MIRRCSQCPLVAVWMYAPYSSTPRDIFFCEDHVPSRGCSCTVELDGTRPRDELGREYPCCEYLYNEKGFLIDV